jgi:DNA invertase Pin-like site-specific DNA recombinase
MPTYAYLRVSTDRQDVDNQRYGIGVCVAAERKTGKLEFDVG